MAFGNALLVAVAVGSAVASAAFFIDRSETARHHDHQRAAVVEAASGKRALLEAQLNARLHLVKGLSALVGLHPDVTPEQFPSFAAALTEDISGVRSVQLAPRAVITHVWPLAGNEQALGHDLLADPKRHEATLRAIDGRRLVVAGPYPLLQGGVGLIARTPIHLGSAPDDHFWGLATVVLDLAPLLESAGIVRRDDMRFALRGRDGLGAAGEVFHGDPDLFDAGAVQMDITLPNGSWRLAALPAAGWSSSRPGRVWFVVASVLLAAAAAAMTWRMLHAMASAHQNELRFRTIFNQTLQGIAVTTPQGVVLDANDTLCDHMGSSGQHLLGQPLWMSDWWSSRPGRAALLEARIASITDTRITRFEILNDGAEPGGIDAVDVAIKPITAPGGRVTSLLIETRDVSERRRTDEQMARNLAVTGVLSRILRLSLEDIPLDMVLDTALGEMLSLPWLRIEPRASIFVADGPSGKLRMAAQRNLPPEIVTACARIAMGWCLCGRAAATGEAVFSGSVDHRHETTFAGMPDHGHYCVPIGAKAKVLGVLNTYVPVGHRRDADQERFLLMVADTLGGIIKRKQVEQDLRDSEELAKALINATDDAAALMDRGGVILSANEAFAGRVGCHADALVGRSAFALLPPELAGDRRSQFDQVLAEGRPLMAHDSRDGRAMDNRIYPVVDSRGLPVQVAIFSRDVTQAREAAERIEKALADLARSNAELEQFAYVASHDLRQPLRMVSSYLGLIAKRLGPTLAGETLEFLTYAIDGARRMDRLILDLLDYSRTGRDDALFEPLPLAAAVADALLNLEVAINEAGGSVTIDGELPTVAGNRGEMLRLFQNLIGNAVKYRAPERPPRVVVGARLDGRDWLLWVRDNGIGIAGKDCERAFGLFQRMVANDAYEGTGIGLAICRKIVEHHGGRIWVDSTPGKGSTFFFTLPRG